MEKYFNGHVAAVSLFCGISGYVFAIFFTESIISAYFALACTLFMMILLPIRLFFREKRYRYFESSFSARMQARVTTHCTFEAIERNGYLYALQSLMCFACFEKKPYFVIRLPFVQIRSAFLLRNDKMRLLLQSGQQMDFTSPDIEKIFLQIQSNASG